MNVCVCVCVCVAESDNSITLLTGIRLVTYYGATDIQEATALTYRNNRIDIYSNSWGPHDNGYSVGGPGQLARRAFETGVKKVH